MEKLTKALMTDETGQAIVTKLTALSGQMHELAMATRGSAILFESESDISVLGDGGYLAVYVGSTNPLVISGWTGDNSLVTGHLYYLIKSGTAVASSDLGEYGGTAVIDSTLSIEGSAADAKAVGDALAEKADADDVTAIDDSIGDLSQLTTTAKDSLVSAVNETDGTITEINERLAQLDGVGAAFDVETHVSENLLNASEIETGCYYWTNGRNANDDYNSTPFIAVEEGQTLYLQTGYESSVSRSNKTMRFVIGYDNSKSLVSSACQSNVTSYTVPQGVSFIIASVVWNTLNASQFPTLLVSETGEVLDYVPYFEPYTSVILKDECNSAQTQQNTSDIEELRQKIFDANISKGIFKASANSLSADTDLVCCSFCDNKKNDYIELTANFVTFGNLTIAHGKGFYMGGYITITPEKIIVYSYNGTQYEEFTHGLTLSDFINVIIYTKNGQNVRSKITIMTAGGDYTADTTRFYGSYGSVLCNADFAMTNVQMRYTVNDASQNVWVFGDSYLSLGDPNRWTYQMIADGHKKCLLSGYGGAKSVNEIKSFRTLIEKTQPQFVVWTLGMNDGDSSTAINVEWKTYADEVIATCENNGVVPILATIPNVPNIIHTFKNTYVRESGKRYVDFAKAVNAESAGASWYTGMLSSDNTHPTALGAKALMRQFLLDVPEVLYAEE